LSEGHKVKVTIMFRGREVYHPELGKKILDSVAEHVAGVGKVEIYPRLDGRNMTMVLAPDKRKRANGQDPDRPTGTRDRAASGTVSTEPDAAPSETPVGTPAETE
jgi:translation initiation factor IF-3